MDRGGCGDGLLGRGDGAEAGGLEVDEEEHG